MNTIKNTELTLAQRTPSYSPFAILYEPRRKPNTATAPRKRGPKSVKQKMIEAAARVNNEHTACAPSDMHKTARILKGGI